MTAQQPATGGTYTRDPISGALTPDAGASALRAPEIPTEETDAAGVDLTSDPEPAPSARPKKGR